MIVLLLHRCDDPLSLPISSAVQNGDQRWPAKPRSESSRLLLTEGADGEVTPSQCQSRKGEHCYGPATCANAWPSVPPTEVGFSFSNPDHAAAGPKKKKEGGCCKRSLKGTLEETVAARSARSTKTTSSTSSSTGGEMSFLNSDFSLFAVFGVFFGVAFFRQQPRLHQFSVATKKERRKEGRSGKKEGKAEPEKIPREHQIK